MKKWQIHQPSEEAAKQIRSSSDLSMLCAQVLAARGMHQHGSGRRQPHLHLRRL